MKITSTDPLILDELFNDLKREHLNPTKESAEVKGGMGACTTIAIVVSVAGVTFKGVDTLLKVLEFLEKQKNYYISITLKDGRKKSLNALSKEEQRRELEAVNGNIQIESIESGRK